MLHPPPKKQLNKTRRSLSCVFVFSSLSRNSRRGHQPQLWTRVLLEVLPLATACSTTSPFPTPMCPVPDHCGAWLPHDSRRYLLWTSRPPAAVFPRASAASFRPCFIFSPLDSLASLWLLIALSRANFCAAWRGVRAVELSDWAARLSKRDQSMAPTAVNCAKAWPRELPRSLWHRGSSNLDELRRNVSIF